MVRSSAARRLLEEYGGDATALWPGGSHVVDVTERLSALDGIGRKKAVMAGEILIRRLGVELAGRDTLAEIEAAARRTWLGVEGVGQRRFATRDSE